MLDVGSDVAVFDEVDAIPTSCTVPDAGMSGVAAAALVDERAHAARRPARVAGVDRRKGDGGRDQETSNYDGVISTDVGLALPTCNRERQF
jgi:hypothetical protein